jgi:hypothetical protein
LFLVGGTILSSSNAGSFDYGSLDALLDEDVEFNAKTLRVFQNSSVSRNSINLGFGESVRVFTELLQALAVI